MSGEKSSLITVIRLLQEDSQQQSHYSDKNNTINQEDNPWAVIRKTKRKKKKTRATNEKLLDVSKSLAGAVSEEQNATDNSNDRGKAPGIVITLKRRLTITITLKQLSLQKL